MFASHFCLKIPRCCHPRHNPSNLSALLKQDGPWPLRFVCPASIVGRHPTFQPGLLLNFLPLPDIRILERTVRLRGTCVFCFMANVVPPCSFRNLAIGTIHPLPTVFGVPQWTAVSRTNPVCFGFTYQPHEILQSMGL